MNQEIEFGDVIICVDKKGNIVNFEASCGGDIDDCVRDVIKFLRMKNLDNEYILEFNDEKLKVTRFSKVKDIVNEYGEKGKLGL